MFNSHSDNSKCVPKKVSRCITPLLVNYRIPDSIGKDIEKKCQCIYPLHDVYIRKVKVLKKPKFDGELVCLI